MAKISYFPIKWICCLFIACIAFLQGEEKLFCPFDDRAWRIGFEAEDGDEKITELVLQNENITHWNELFTLQVFLNFSSVSASDFMTVLERATKKNIPLSEKLQFNIIEKDPLYIFESSFIFKREKDQNTTIANDEYNIGRIIKSKTNIYYIRYSTKDANLFKQNREAWINRFKQAYVASTPRENQKERWLTFGSKGVYDQSKQLVYQPEYQFIENKKVRYALSIPKDWKVDNLDVNEHAPASSSFQKSLQLSSPNEGVEGKVNFVNLSDDASPKTALTQLSHLYQKEHSQAKVNNQGNIQTVSGQEGQYLILEEGNKTGWIVFIGSSSRIYCLELWTPREKFNDLKNTLENIIMNFQVQI